MLKKIKHVFAFLLFFYFTSMIIILGNGSSFLGRYFEAVFNPVANTIGLNTTWNFFSPDPAHVMYIKYFVFFEDELGATLKEPVQGFYPPIENQTEDFKLHKKRHSYAMRFMIIDPNRLQNFFSPWLCRQHPGASKVQVELIINRIPSLDKVVSLVNSNTETYENLVTTDEMNRYVFECAHAG